MATLRILLVISMLAAVAPAVVKREEYQPSDHHHSAHHQQSSPVYNGHTMYSQKEPNSFGNTFAQSTQLLYNQQHSSVSAGSSGSSQVDYPEPAASNVQPNTAPLNGPSNGSPNGAPSSFQPQPNQAQPNLYYYYYPVQQDNKPKDAYQAQPSNQYSSQVQPNNPNAQPLHNGPDDQNNNQVSFHFIFKIKINRNHDKHFTFQPISPPEQCRSGPRFELRSTGSVVHGQFERKCKQRRARSIERRSRKCAVRYRPEQLGVQSATVRFRIERWPRLRWI